MVTLHTPQGIIEVDPATITDEELAALGLTREWADEQVYQQQLAVDMNEIHDTAILAYKNWDSLTPAQKDTILKNVIKWALWKDRRLKLGVL